MGRSEWFDSHVSRDQSMNGDLEAPIDFCVVGGCGHVGLPLAMAFARKGIQTASFDINPAAVALVNSGQMPFDEPQAPEILSEILAAVRFEPLPIQRL